MANITAALVKELRERTGAGMMDCKKALVECDGDMDKAIDFLREKGLAAANPQYVRRDEVPTDNLEKEREVLTQQALNEGKPAKIVERMVEGRIEKYYKEVCLLEQPFVKDPDINVTKMLGGKADVVRFVRFERGEGLEKRQDNLAADIAAEQAKMKK